MRGVSGVEVDLQANLTTVVPEDDVALDLAAVPRAVRSSGFRAGEMRLRARGRFEGDGAALAFRITGWTEALPVRGPGAPPVPAEAEAGTRAIEARVVTAGGSPALEMVSVVR